MKMLSIKDAENLFNIIHESRQHLRKWLPWVDDTTSVADSISFIKNGFQIYAERTAVTAGVFYKNELVGIAGFNCFDWKNRISQIGYWLSINFQGKGIMTRVVKALTYYAFNRLDLNRVEIRVAPDNKKSRAIPERLNFKNEGHLRQTEWLYDHYVDHIIYAVLKEEWGDLKKINNLFPGK